MTTSSTIDATMRRPVTSESRIVAPERSTSRKRGAGQVDAAEGGAAEGIGVVVVGRHPGIVAETADGGRLTAR